MTWSGAQQQYKAAIAVKPDDPTAVGAYALSLAMSGHSGEADAFLTTQAQKHPSSAPITTFLAEVEVDGARFGHLLSSWRKTRSG